MKNPNDYSKKSSFHKICIRVKVSNCMMNIIFVLFHACLEREGQVVKVDDRSIFARSLASFGDQR